MRRLDPGQREYAEVIVQAYQSSLTLASDYLTSRSITPEAAVHFRLGFVADPIAGHEAYRGRLVIPYLTVSGPVAMKFRCIQDHNCKESGHVKYLYADGSGGWLFGARAVLTAPDLPVVLTEGELDAVTVWQCGLPAVGYPGVGSWSAPSARHWPRVFDGRRVIVLADGDEPGTKSAKAVLRDLDDARIVQMPDGFDANRFYVERGGKELLNLLGFEASDIW